MRAQHTPTCRVTITQMADDSAAYLSETCTCGLATSVAPISLNATQEAAVHDWAADDRLWTTQETVEFNLRLFARVILAGRQERD